MATTTSYGTWVNNVDDLCLTVEQYVADALGDYAGDYDLDGLVGAYRAAINDALPHNVALAGDEFIGPYYEADQDFDGYPLTDDGALDIKAIVDGINFWSLAAEYDNAA